MNPLALITVIAALLSLGSLLLLHFTSPEFGPGWRMISEYAMGRFKWLITSFFLFWGLSSVILAVLLYGYIHSFWAWAGFVLLLLSAVGEIMGGLFDVKHKWHGLAFGLGVPSLPVAALLLSYQLLPVLESPGAGTLLITAAHLTWISLLLMGAAMGISMSAFKKAGITFEGPLPPEAKLPKGVPPVAGWANRFLVVCYVGWIVVCAVAVGQLWSWE